MGVLVLFQQKQGKLLKGIYAVLLLQSALLVLLTRSEVKLNGVVDSSVVCEVHFSYKHVCSVLQQFAWNKSEELAISVGLVVVDSWCSCPLDIIGADGPVSIKTVANNLAERLLVTVNIDRVALYFKLGHLISTKPFHGCFCPVGEGAFRLARIPH